MSKRPHSEPSSLPEKRIKKDHAPDCNDTSCQGCDVGEVEILFLNKDKLPTDPTAHQLLAMAIEESIRPDDGIAPRLFDMALEKYQKDENRIGYATCLVELGKALGVEESLSEGLEILRGLKKRGSDVDLGLAGAAIALAAAKRKAQNAYFEQQQKELEGSDGEMDDVAFSELVEKQRVSKEEKKLVKEAIEAAQNASFEDEKAVHVVLHELRGYGQLLTQPFHREDANYVLNAAIELVQKIPEYEKKDGLLAIWAACLIHQEKFEEEKKEALLKEAEEKLLKANELHVKEHKKENSHYLELLAMLRINQSNLAEDEDQALDLYDEAIQFFKKAYKLDPENVKLAEMVAVLDAYEEQE